MTHTRGVLSHFLLLPELEFLSSRKLGRWGWEVCAVKRRAVCEVCPRCASPSQTIYDSREVVLKDCPVRDKLLVLRVKKRRYYCQPCRRPFTEPLPGVRKGYRCTERYRKALRWAAETFTDLKKVQRYLRCSAGWMYENYYEQLELRRKRNLNYPWPTSLGVDEIAFKRHPKLGVTEYATVFVDHPNRRVYELCGGKNISQLFDQLKARPAGENVRHVSLDLSEGYRSLCRALFPNATLTADKFHVLRLLVPAIHRRRHQIAGHIRKQRIGKLLLKSSQDLDFSTRAFIARFLEPHQELKAIYHFKERLHRLYRIKGWRRAAAAFDRILTDLKSFAPIPELAKLRRTLKRWRTEILNYFRTGLTNARTEGFNNVAKLVKRRGYGYRNLNNYRLRLLDTCF